MSTRNDRVMVSLAPGDWKLLDGLRVVFLADNYAAAVRQAIRFAARELDINGDENDTDHPNAHQPPKVRKPRVGVRNNG